MKTKKKIKSNSKTKTKKNFINSFYKKIKSIGSNKPTFLSSCFQYYYGNIQLCNKSCKQVVLTRSFLDTRMKGPLVIMDYPNIIHVLYEKYKDRNKVIKHFYTFIYNELHKSTKFYIIAKKVIIDGIPLHVEIIFNEGYKLTGKLIEKKYFDEEYLNIYNLSYKRKEKISSSIDDLLGYFICFVLYVYLVNNNINPRDKSNSTFNKINIITNDKQFFNKNLFGLTEDERKYHIQIIKDLSVEKLMLEKEHYIFIQNKMDQVLISHFLNEYMVTTSNDIKNLECKLFILLQILHNNIPKKNTLSFFSYENLNELQKKYLKKYTIKNKKKCTGLKNVVTKENNIIPYYYLYTFIKYIQMHLHTHDKNGIQYGDFYGSLKKEEIIHLIN